MVSPSGTSGRQRELARSGPEAEVDQRLLVGRADDRLPVDALERQPPHPPAPHGLGEGLERGGDAPVAGLRQYLQALAAALDIEDRLRAGEHDIGARLAG